MRYAQELRLPELTNQTDDLHRCTDALAPTGTLKTTTTPTTALFKAARGGNSEGRPIQYPPCTGPLYAQGMGHEPLQAGSVNVSGYYDLRKYRGDVLWCKDKHGRTTKMLWPEEELSLTPWGAPPAYEEVGSHASQSGGKGSPHARQSGGEGSSHARQSVWGKEKKQVTH